MKTLGTVTFVLLVMVILTGCGATQPVSFAAAKQAAAYDCSSGDVEMTKAQIQDEIDAYEKAGLEVPADLNESLNQAKACGDSNQEKAFMTIGPGSSDLKQTYTGGPRPLAPTPGAQPCPTMFCK